MTEPAPTVRNTPDDAGAILREARLRKGQTIETVFQHTRIPKKFIEALEANRYDVFPAKVYLQGFLKSYCDHLDVDFEQLWKKISPPQPLDEKPEHKAEHAAPAAPPPSSPAPAAHPAAHPAVHPAGHHAPVSAPKPRPVASHAKTTDDEPSKTIPSHRPAAVEPKPESTKEPVSTASSWAPTVLVGVLAVAGIGGWLLLRPHAAPPPPAPVKLPAALTPIKIQEKMTLKITFKKETWLRLRCDGRLRFEGRAPADFSQQWSASNDFVLRTQTPEDLALNLDGKDVTLTPGMKDSSGDYKIARP